METPREQAQSTSLTTTGGRGGQVSTFDEDRYKRDRQLAFYSGEQRHEESAALQQRNEMRAIAGEQRAIEGHRLSLRADQRAMTQMREQREERMYQHWMQAKQEQRAIEGHEMHKESHALQMQTEREKREAHQRARELSAARFNDPRTSGVLGNAKFGTVEDADIFGLTDEGGLFLGTLEGQGLHYSGAAHLLTYAPTRAGKGLNVITQNLAHVDGRLDKRSMVVVDVKNGENAYASAEHRMANLGDRVIMLNPYGLVGGKHTRINPLDRVAMGPRDEIIDRAAAIAYVLVPPKADNKDAWVTEGARQILQTVIAHYALTDPARCTLGNLWRFVMRDTKAIRIDFRVMEKSSLAAVAGYAGLFLGWMDAHAQWAAYMSEMSTCLNAFEPDSPYTKATDVSEWDAQDMTLSPHTVYVMMKGKHLKSKGKWVSLMINHLIETAAESPGAYSPLFMLDEFTQLPPIPAVMNALNLYAGLGIQLWFFAQDRKSIAALYGDDGAARIESQCEVMQAWRFRDVGLMKDIEYWAGKTSVKLINANMSDGEQLGTGLTLTEQARPLLQAEDMRNMAHDDQFIFLQRGPVFKAKLQPVTTTEDHAEVIRDVRDILTGAKLPPSDSEVWRFPDDIPADLHPLVYPLSDVEQSAFPAPEADDFQDNDLPPTEGQPKP
jgi:type IV secretion system protein VirD4